MTPINDMAVDFSDYNERRKVVAEIEKDLHDNWEEAIAKLRDYQSHESEELGRDLYALVWRFGTGLDNPVKRQQLVRHLLAGVEQGTPFIKGQVLKFLMDFQPGDFNEPSVEALTSLPWDADFGAATIRLIGIANIQTKISELQMLATSKVEEGNPDSFYAGRQWAALLALSRMGDAESIARVTRTVQADQDIVRRAALLFTDLAFTRHPAAFDLLRIYLQSLERLPQVKKTVPGRLEASYAATMFARHVDGCPVRGEDVKDAEIEIIKNWAIQQTVWKIE